MSIMNKKIGLGFVGLSARRGWAAASHIPAIANLPQYEIRALTASSPETAKAAADRYKVPFWSDSEALLAARPEVDVVVVTVKVTKHRVPVETALNAGKHVLCEWPLGMNAADAVAMANLAEAKGVRGFIGLQARFSPWLSYIRDLLADGYLGEILSTTVLGIGGVVADGRISRAASLYVDRSFGSGMINIPFSHSIDGLCSVFGELEQIKSTVATRRPTLVFAETGETVKATTFDQVAISGLFGNGVVASIHYREGTPQGTGFRWEINGTKGTMVVTTPAANSWMVPLKIEAALVGTAGFTILTIPQKYIPHPGYSSVEGLYAALAHDLRDGTHTVATFNDAVRRHRMIEEIADSVS